MESNVLCKALCGDVWSRLEQSSSDPVIVQKKFELIENIAQKLKIGDRFKAKAAKACPAKAAKVTAASPWNAIVTAAMIREVFRWLIQIQP